MHLIKYIILLAVLLQVHKSAYSAKLIKLATADWSPYIGKELKQQGLISEIVRSALAAEGYQLELIFLPWMRAVSEAEKGKEHIAGYFPEYHDISKEDKFLFSDSFLASEVGLLIRKNDEQKLKIQIYPKDLKKTYELLKKYRFGIVRGYLNEEIFDRDTSLIKIDSTTDEKNMHMLDEGKVDIILIDRYVANYYKNNSPDLLVAKNEFLFIKPAIKAHHLYIAWSKSAKDYQNYSKIFNQGLQKILRNGEYQRILKRFQNIK